MNHKDFIAPPGKKIRLKDFDSASTGEFKEKENAVAAMREDIERLSERQEILYAQDRYALLVIFQAMDAAGKDGAIRHVMSGVNPQGCQVYSFKAPSAEELDHDYLWRCAKAMPERGRIGIFNRSYYEEVLVVRVHPELLERQQLPPGTIDENIWQRRFEEINNYEKYLVDNGIIVVKIFLNVSRKEQKKRFLARIETPDKNWKFSLGDINERGHWDDYMQAYEDIFTHTSTEHAPWYVVPADRKWFARAAVADIISAKLDSLHLKFPTVTDEQKAGLLKAKEMLENE